MRTLVMCAVLTLVACGSPSTPDAGPDTSCGLDCAAQQRFGLLVNRCIEYSDDPLNKKDPPDLGAWVRPVRTLEGNVKVLPMEYRKGGAKVMEDSFAIVGGDLYLMRREFVGGQSVTWKTDGGITGVKWLPQDVGVGENYNTTTEAFVVNQAGQGATTATTYRITTAAPTTSEARTPLQVFDGGIKLIPGESPDHGADTRRIFVPEVGFVVIASSFSLTGGSALPLAAQRIREPGTPDGGVEDCGAGMP